MAPMVHAIQDIRRAEAWTLWRKHRWRRGIVVLERTLGVSYSVSNVTGVCVVDLELESRR
jgi:hypothetical protein